MTPAFGVRKGGTGSEIRRKRLDFSPSTTWELPRTGHPGKTTEPTEDAWRVALCLEVNFCWNL